MIPVTSFQAWFVLHNAFLLILFFVFLPFSNSKWELTLGRNLSCEWEDWRNVKSKNSIGLFEGVKHLELSLHCIITNFHTIKKSQFRCMFCCLLLLLLVMHIHRKQMAVCLFVTQTYFAPTGQKCAQWNQKNEVLYKQAVPLAQEVRIATKCALEAVNLYMNDTYL